MGDEKKIVRLLAEALEVIPDNKKEWFLGYAECYADMSEKTRAAPDPETTKAS